ncbi:hypothetical protein [Mesoaciditoga sp.]
MRYVTSGVLAVVIELLLLVGVVGMVNSSPKKVVSYPKVISINLAAAPAVTVKSAIQHKSVQKGEKGSAPLSEEDMKILSALERLPTTPKKKRGNPKGNSRVQLFEKAASSTLNASNVELTPPNDVNPIMSKSFNPQEAQANASITSIYNFSQLVNLGIPNFEEIEGSMKKDYELALAKLPTEKAYTLGGMVKGIVEVQKDGTVRVQKIISSPSVTLTDIYVRNIEKMITFPRSFALKDIEIDAYFNPSSKAIQ